tara:strand:- start:748 stop:1101 length:354 start_codon:yes stop_codon:yes gene_type:complete
MKQQSINSIQEELVQHIEDIYENNHLQEDEAELHHQLFNEDYYIIGYYNAEKWLKEHNVTIFEGIEYVQDYERHNFGECQNYTDAENLVNMIVYVIGWSALAEYILLKDKNLSNIIS